MAIVYIGLGSNLGDREGNIRKALEHVESSGEVEILRVSDLVETGHVGGPSQPTYLNGVAEVRTELAPKALLGLLKAAERAAGRSPSGVRWGPREADLDILLYEDLVLDEPGLTIPHPRMRDREFVLVPLIAVAPEARDPITKKTAREMLDSLRRRRAGKKTIRLLETVADIRDYVGMLKRNRFTVGFVPTMGAFHLGHLALMHAARDNCDKVIVSLFVNPKQFGPNEDLDDYPSTLERDLRLALEVGVDVVFAPSAEEIYPEGFSTWVTVEGLSDLHCGASRPGHFRGVTTVVAKLFHLVQPDFAFFGEKDYQQLTIVRRMVRDLAMDVRIEAIPTVREDDGLAMSSRNQYLSAPERERATSLSRALFAARGAYEGGERAGEALLAEARNVLEATDGIDPEYLVLVHPETLAPVDSAAEGAVMLVAAQVGPARLIDNVVLGGEA